MRTRISLSTLLMAFLWMPAVAQNYQDSFKVLIAQDNPELTLDLLGKWKKAKPDDPEMYVAYYNLYAKEGLKEVLALTKDAPQGKSLEIKDSTGKVAGYLGGTGGHNDAYLDKGFKLIDSAVAKFPARLDMRFGKVYVLGKIGDYDNFTKEIIKTITYGESTGLKWLWSGGKPIDDPKEFMLSTVQSYVVQLYNAGDKNAGNIKAISETVLKYHPAHVESLSNLSIACMINGDFAAALVPLLKAEKINPQDYIVLNNIAHCYNMMKDKPNAIKYYELAVKYGNEEVKNQAIEKLKELKK